MAEKGGKVSSFSKGRKSALKSSTGKDASLKGKVSNSSKQGRVIEFDNSSDSEGSPRANNSAALKSGGKFSSETPVSKGGKAEQTRKSGEKGSIPDITSIPKLNIEKELPKNAVCLMDCEAADVLQGIQEKLVVLSDDAAIELPGSFDKGLSYAKLGRHYASPPAVRQVLETLRSHQVSDGEMCLIGNTCPETADELFALIPSLKDNRFRIEKPTKDMLSELAKLKSGK